jgi:hypothetical protein
LANISIDWPVFIYWPIPSNIPRFWLNIRIAL